MSLFIVPTPIGNLEDMTFRAVRVLKEVDLILAEDTRTSGVLLKHYDIQTPATSFHAFNEHQRVEQLLAELREGKNMALISDAGTPGISDPGYLLISKAVKEGLHLDALPGPTAFVPALLKSGFPTDKFLYEGFLPHKKGRQTRLKILAEEQRTIVLYESPHRLEKTLRQIQEFFRPSTMVSVSRELTKKFEETITGEIEDVLLHFVDKKPKGEFVVVIKNQKDD